jgi:hypothetical protein
MKKFIYLFACSFVYFFNTYAQECGFEMPENYQTYDRPSNTNGENASTSVMGNYCINVCFRIMRDDNGSNAAVNPSIIPQALALLNLRYNPHGITFYQIGTYDYINDTHYNNDAFPPATSTPPALIPNCF